MHVSGIDTLATNDYQHAWERGKDSRSFEEDSWYDTWRSQTRRNPGFDIDDGTGLRVARARFESESKFAWSLFDGFDRIRILTYSAGVSAIVRLLDRHGFSDFECVFGCENTLRTLRDIMAFQQVAIGDTRAAIKNLPDERHAFILSRVGTGRPGFEYCVKRLPTPSCTS